MVRLNLTEVRWQLVNEERDKSLVNFKSYKQKKGKDLYGGDCKCGRAVLCLQIKL